MAVNTGDLDSLFSEINLADSLDKEQLDKLGQDVLHCFEQDLNSRKTWEKQHNQWMKLAIQVIEEKTWPWRNAANVKYPLLSMSALQFQARAYPTLVAGPNVVKARVIGEDPTGEKQKRAERISKHMSFQVLEEMPDWDEDMDKACFILPIVGCIFKKIYWCAPEGTNKSELVLAKDLVVNYWAKSLELASTKTHVLYMNKNSIKEMQLQGEWCDFNLDTCSAKELESDRIARENEGLQGPGNFEDAPLTVLEQHRWDDLDDDGYKEPYIVTVEYSTGQVLRVTPRYEKDGVHLNDEGKIIKIDPEEYFVKFSFIPNPDGGFYDLGFGALLGPLNVTVNTLIDQLLDSGTINNLQAGFIAKGIRLKGGDTPFNPGEWKVVQTTGDDLRKGILPLPTKEPSGTLFQLLGTIVESGQKLASVAEIFVGKMPGQNTPATTTMATIEQGMKVFTAIYKRIYRSLTKEFKRLYRLNKIYLPAQQEFVVLDSLDLQKIGQSDYQQDDSDVRPAADPTTVSEQLRLTKAQALLEMIPLGTINAQEATKRVLEAMEQPDVEKLLTVQPPPPDPKVMQTQAKMQQDQQKGQMKMQEMSLKQQIEAQKAALDEKSKEMDMMYKALELKMKEAENALELTHSHQKAMLDLAVSAQAAVQKKQEGDMKLQHQQESHKQKLQQAKTKEK